jgi:GNAT superfamily N-acetyltransferase
VPHFDIVKHNEIEAKSFRVAQLYDQFDITGDRFDERFTGDIEPPESWSIGVIVGKSGTGKTTIARELFGEYFAHFDYSASCVVDDFDKSIPSVELFGVLSSVGFASPPSWLKPYSVLSNGEKMRVDLARAILQDQEIIIFDEYTSVVDREVAQIGSLALQKSVRRAGKRFIAVTCHYDVIEWLEPDWVFSTDEMTMTRGSVRRPKIDIEVRKIKGLWGMFRRYHYLNHDISRSADEFVAFYHDKPIGFSAWIHFPNNMGLSMMKGHRFVVLPDYQGVGLNSRLVNFCADYYNSKIDFVGITTSHKGFAKAWMREKNWRLIRAGHTSINTNIKALNKSVSSARNTYSFRYFPKREGAANV